MNAPAPGVGVSAAVERGRFASRGFACEMQDDSFKSDDEVEVGSCMRQHSETPHYLTGFGGL